MLQARLFCSIAAICLFAAACQPGNSSRENHMAVTPDPVITTQILSDDVAYLTQLGLIRGHVFAGASLYRQGEHEEALAHLTYPVDKLYAELLPGLQQRAGAELASPLAVLVNALETHASEVEVDRLVADLLAEITQAEAAATGLTAGHIARVIEGLLEHTSQQYGLAVNADGLLLSAHDYQHCLGYVEVAIEYLDSLRQHSDEPARIQGLHQQLAFLQQVFPTAVPSTRTPLTQPATVNQVIERVGVTLAAFPL